jgi:DNA-binding CsgD family transcriptional regulator
MPAPTSAHERKLDELADACDRAPDELALFEDFSRRLNEVVPFDGAAWFGTDPATVLASSAVRIENVEQGHCESYWERECTVEDSMLFRDLARSPQGIGTLYDTTGDQPTRSARYREFLAPQGYGDELRAAFRVGESTWGVMDIYRDRSRAAFSPREVEQVRRVAPAVATALRGFAARTTVSVSPDAPGTALFDDRGRALSLDAQARDLFEEIGGVEWAERPLCMTPVFAVVARAAAVRDGRDSGPATARLRSPSGRWLVVHASSLTGADGAAGPTALTIEPAKSAQMAPIIVEAYCLTAREQDITHAVARGLSNQEIAAALFLSPHTVRDHLKAIFAKVGVSSRGELVAKLFADHYGPVLHTPGAAVEHVQFG